jgi:16S rRNA (adenine1518-N6/adenine1519-N6)-dimethyltransferase
MPSPDGFDPNIMQICRWFHMFLTPQQYFASRVERPRKRFGQHFLAQPRTAERIVEASNLSPHDVVVEVGPGLGALTRFILPQVGRVHLVEIDRDLCAYLKEALGDSSPHASILQKDILDFDFQALGASEGQRLVVLGNLPYNISSPLMFRMLESRSVIQRVVAMVQKEVGVRWTAAPGGKDYGVLSVLLGVYARSRRLFEVGPGQFYPPPRVDSMVVSVDFESPWADPVPPFRLMRGLLNTAFQKRRKTLNNSLKSFGGVSVEVLQSCFAAAGIAGSRRPESLSPEEFIRLALEVESRLSVSGR